MAFYAFAILIIFS